MSLNLIDAAKSLFTNELVSKASSYFGESESSVSKAVSGVIPTVLSGISSKMGSTDGANTVAQMVSDQHDSGILNNLSSFFGNDGGGLLNKGAGLLSSIFGSKLDGVTSLLSNFSGLKSGSTSGILSMVAPVLLGLIGKHSNGGASGIASLLSHQSNNVAAAVPSGLNLSSVLPSATTTTSTLKTAATEVVDDAENAGGGALRYLLPLLLLAAAAIGAWYLFSGKGCGKGAETTTTTTVDTTKMTTDVAPTVIVPTHESMKVKLANGTELNAYKGGIESQLVAFLDDKSKPVDTVKGNWFDFDNLNFKLGKADITDSSMIQINNLAAILKAYPATKFRIGGYTDASGNTDANLKLSQQRADAVKAAVVKAGGAIDQLVEAKGYGSQFAKQPATASDSLRAFDRRTAIRVMTK